MNYPKNGLVRRLAISFPFSEINAAVFQNAGIYLHQKVYGNQIAAYSPQEFLGCYFHANEVHEIVPTTFDNYSEVSNYRLSTFSRNDFTSWFGAQLPNYLYQTFLSKLSPKLFHLLPAFFQADYKMRKYLHQSGIYRFVVTTCKEFGEEFLGATSYFDLATMTQLKCDSKEAFRVHFRNLQKMILEGGIQSTQNRAEFFQKWQSNPRISMIQLSDFKAAKEFIGSGEKVFFVRTRNISGTASVHNTNLTMLRFVILEALRNGHKVVSSGTPAPRLDIKHPSYFEFSHNLPVVVQQFLAEKCDRIVTSAEAGLFTAWAATDLPLITFGREWSVTNLTAELSLLEARRTLGLKDFSIGDGTDLDLIRHVFFP